MGEVAGAVAEISVCLLEVDWRRVVHAGLDAAPKQDLANDVPAAHAHGVDVVDVLSVRHLFGGHDLPAVQEPRVAGRAPAAGLGPAVQVPQLDGQDRALKLVHTVVEAPDDVSVLPV